MTDGSWLRGSWLDEAATVTVCADTTVDAVQHAFGAEPGPLSQETVFALQEAVDPLVVAIPLGHGGVLAVEANGWQGSTGPTLRRLPTIGRASSVFWNVDAVHALAFAEAGEVLSSTTDYGWSPLPTEPRSVADAMRGLDFAEWETRRERALIAARRFTGVTIGPDDIAATMRPELVRRIVPWLPDLHPSPAGADVMARRELAAAHVGSEHVALGSAPDDALADLAWSLAEHVARADGLLPASSAATATVLARELTPEAELLARRSTLHDGRHLVGWAVLHDATNPDPFNAVLTVHSRARHITPAATESLIRAALAHHHG